MRLLHLTVFFASLIGSSACAPFKTVPPQPGLPHVLQLSENDAATHSRFDPSHSPVVPLLRTNDSLLVRPLINGQDIGWFILDTGASGLTITQDGAEKAALKPIAVTSVQGKLPTILYQGESLKVGQLTLLGPRFAGLDMPWSKFYFGEKVRGICGWDIFANSIVEIDTRDHAVLVHAPDQLNIDEALWRPMKVVASRPHVIAQFETEEGTLGEGEFLLDTGFSGSVWLFPQIAGDLALAEQSHGRKRKLVMVDATAHVRKIDLRWFEFAGRTNREFSALISAGQARTRQEASKLAGMIGLESLDDARLIIDYPGERIALLSLEPPAAASRSGDRQ